MGHDCMEFRKIQSSDHSVSFLRVPPFLSTSPLQCFLQTVQETVPSCCSLSQLLSFGFKQLSSQSLEPWYCCLFPWHLNKSLKQIYSLGSSMPEKSHVFLVLPASPGPAPHSPAICFSILSLLYLLQFVLKDPKGPFLFTSGISVAPDNFVPIFLLKPSYSWPWHLLLTLTLLPYWFFCCLPECPLLSLQRCLPTSTHGPIISSSLSVSPSPSFTLISIMKSVTQTLKSVTLDLTLSLNFRRYFQPSAGPFHHNVHWSAEIHACVLPLKLFPPLTFRISQNSSVILPVTLNFPDTFLIPKTGQFPLHIFCHNHPLISIHAAAISCPNFSGPAPEGCQSTSN